MTEKISYLWSTPVSEAAAKLLDDLEAIQTKVDEVCGFHLIQDSRVPEDTVYLLDQHNKLMLAKLFNLGPSKVTLFTNAED